MNVIKEKRLNIEKMYEAESAADVEAGAPPPDSGIDCSRWVNATWTSPLVFLSGGM